MRAHRGNAVLISLVIMASALSISLGMTTLVTGEIRNVAQIGPAERAYYKAESYVEAGLAAKKQNTSYNVTSKDDPSVKGQPYVCDAVPCFRTDPTAPDELLVSFMATTAPAGANGVLQLFQDNSQQVDLGTTGLATNTGTITLSNFTGTTTGKFLGVEVTIAAYNLAGRYPNPNPVVAGATNTTPVFIDKRLIKSPGGSISIGSGQKNSLGESYPALSGATYRLRLKALGSNAGVTLKATAGAVTLPLLSTDFTVQAVAEDGPAQRGVRVVTPAVTQNLSIFDYVLFAELDLKKLAAKDPALPGTSVRIPGRSFSDCSKRDDPIFHCRLDDPDPEVVYNLGAPGTFSYQTVLNPGNYKLVITYKNETDQGYFAPPGYAYSIHILVNNQLPATAVTLPVQGGAAGAMPRDSAPIPLYLPANAVVRIIWDNDIFNPPFDSNFAIKAIKLDP
jgi:hypothetical protein